MSSVIDTSIWKNAPRFCTTLPLPPYRYLPGKNVHPGKDHLPAMGDRAFFYGVDLYHAGFFYEAHEAWESIWLTLPRGDLQRTFLLGLIQNTAAQLKLTLGQWVPAVVLSRRSFHYLELVRTYENPFMGLDLTRFNDDMRRYYSPLWKSSFKGGALPTGQVPCLNISISK